MCDVCFCVRCDGDRGETLFILGMHILHVCVCLRLISS